MALFSIIIPVYNGAAWLHHSLHSLLAQSVRDWEAICIDDGSTDSTLATLGEWERRDSRIRVSAQENQGVSAARNAGIEQARGDYLLFLDADDWFLPHSLAFLMEQMVRYPDAHLIFSLQHYYEDGQKDNVVLPPMRFEERNYPYQFSLNIKDIYNLRPNAVNHLYRRELVMQRQIRFPVDVPHGEDTYFMLDYLTHIEQFVAYNEPLYQYYQRADSACNHPEIFNRPVEYFMKTIRCYIHLADNVGTSLSFRRAEVWKLAFFLRGMRESYDIVTWMYGEGAHNSELVQAMEEMRGELRRKCSLFTKLFLKFPFLQKFLS